MQLTQRSIRALADVYGPEGFNIGINQGKVAGAGVENHIHQHVVPRWGADTNFMPVIGSTRVLPQSLADSYRALSERFWHGGPRASSRPTTFAASTASRSTRRSRTALGRGFARVLGDLEGKPAAELRVGLGRDMRLAAPALSERYADGIRDEGADVLDVGEVGTEMLYFTVGSRGLDGGLMCTASHNPKAYTGAKLVRSGAIALSGDSGIGELKEIVTGGEPGDPADPRGEYEREDVAEDFQAAAAALRGPRRDPADEGGPRRRQRHGGADGRAAARPAADRAGADLLDPRRELPRPRAQPAAAGEPPLHRREGPLRGRRARHRVGRRRRPLLLHRRHRPVRGRRLPDRAARRVDPREGARRGDPLRRAREPRGAGHRRARRRHGARQPRGPRVLQVADARRGRRVRRRGLGPLLLPRLLLRGLGHDPGAAHPRAPVHARQAHERAARAAARALLHLRRDQLGGRRPGREDAGDRMRPTRTARSAGSTACRSTTTTGTSTSGRPTPSRCCASTSSRSSRPTTWSRSATRCSR